MTAEDKVIRLHPECMRCMMEKQLRNCPPHLSEERKVEYMQRVFGILAAADASTGAPQLVADFDHMMGEFCGQKEDFAEIKRHFNALMLSFVPGISAKIRAAEDPLEMAAAYAMAGNFIDFGAVEDVSEEKLREFLKGAENFRIGGEDWLHFKETLKKAKRVVYIPDNCGEIVMDMLFIREMGRVNPSAHITAMVKGGPALNDATREDAGQIGLSEVAEVADTGCAYCGTPLSRISGQAEKLLREADLILAKGPANYETLNGCGWNVYYLFMCKCEFFAERFKVPRFGGVFIRE